jgi:adenine-specific DNA-methyltransferase
VRLLHDAGTVGTVLPDKYRAGDNLLIRGDALSALHSLTALPEFSKEYVGKVRLVYVDAPFNTQQAFTEYDDALEHSVWLTMMRDRLAQLKQVLSEDGSIWVHLDDAEVAYCRVLMDELFGRDSFVGTVVWKRRNDPRNTAPFLSMDHDTILVYAKNVSKLRTNRLERTEAMDMAYTNPDDDHRGPWRRGDLAARNYYSKGLYPVTTPSGRIIDGPPTGSYWRSAPEELDRLDKDGRIYWGKDGSSRPSLKRFLSEVSSGRVPSSVWAPEEVGFVRNGKEEVRALVGDVFATPKPERLIERIMHIGSDPGDIVLDCFLGSGTTAAVAHKMGRRWVGIEHSRETIETYAMPRLTKVVAGQDAGGITDSADWEGGGGFRVLDVAPSMFQDDEGVVVISEWASNNELAEATAAQFGYQYESDAPFAGRKGRFRLAVIDGNVSSNVVELLAGALGPSERLLVCGTSLDPDAAATLRKLSPGSEARKVPASILVDYRLAHRWQARPALSNGAAARLAATDGSDTRLPPATAVTA